MESRGIWRLGVDRRPSKECGPGADGQPLCQVMKISVSAFTQLIKTQQGSLAINLMAHQITIRTVKPSELESCFCFQPSSSGSSAAHMASTARMPGQEARVKGQSQARPGPVRKIFALPDLSPPSGLTGHLIIN